ncbi:hypothetical protein RhoFasGS6_03946 [Rhodococcus fascians]|nr:hypothetical protein [Rhodococcus fascians]
MEVTGFDPKELRKAFDALAYASPRFFEKSGRDEYSADSFSRPTERARREVGQWPSADSVLEALVQRLSEVAEDDAEDAVTRSRARKVLDAVVGDGRQVISGVMAAVISAQFGIMPS